MRFPLALTTRIAGYIARKKLARTEKFPLVLMLEPLHACNLTCTGCGRIREYESTIKQKLSIEECLDSVDECGAPVVRICGGEPMIYPGIGELVAKILERKKSSTSAPTACSSARSSHEFKPDAASSSTSTSTACGRRTTSPSSARASSTRRSTASRPPRRPASWSAPTRRSTRKPTWPRSTSCSPILTTLGVDGFMISPAYSYAAVDSKEIFMTRDDIRAKFRAAEAMFRKYKFNSSPVYLEFLQGKRELTCTAWANPTRNIKGWKGPCYLITDNHHATLRRPDEQDRLGEVRLRQGPALRELHGALRLRAVGRPGRQQPARRHAQDDQVAVPLSRPGAAPAARTSGVKPSTAPIAHERPGRPAAGSCSRPGGRRHRHGPADRGGLPDRQPEEGPQVLRAAPHGRRG